MGKKVKAEFKQGLTLGFDMPFGTFQWCCGACDFPYFDFNDDKTRLICDSCGAENAQLQLPVESEKSKIEWKV
jgi:hypothetical protein